MSIASLVQRSLYALGSLENVGAGFQFRIQNAAADATVTRIFSMRVDATDVPLDALDLDLGEGRVLPARDVTPERPAAIARSQSARVQVRSPQLTAGPHEITLALEVAPFGRLELHAHDAIGAPHAHDGPARSVPYVKDPALDYAPDEIAARRRYVEEHTGARLEHTSRASFDPAITRGNIENFTGVAQVPLGFAGPLRVNGEHAQGDFLIPLATTEGTLVASYGRGMKVLNLCGGATCTVEGDRMQRAPVFIFDSARDARNFRSWVHEHIGDIRQAAEATSHVAKLAMIEDYLASKFAYLRFDYTTGDAAGQNMVGRATLAACEWIRANAPGVRAFYLEANLATDKKVSHINTLRTRGKRVTAEATITRQALAEHMRVTPEALLQLGGAGNVGAFLSGATSNGLHAANALTAMFIATGQDVANVTEGSTAVVYAEPTLAGDLYMSVTLPSLIVATYGGGTGLATQRECLEVLGCYGMGKVNKLAEVVAAVVLAGELSLASAIAAVEWVSAHEKLGRNR